MPVLVAVGTAQSPVTHTEHPSLLRSPPGMHMRVRVLCGAATSRVQEMQRLALIRGKK